MHPARGFEAVFAASPATPPRRARFAMIDFGIEIDIDLSAIKREVYRALGEHVGRGVWPHTRGHREDLVGRAPPAVAQVPSEAMSTTNR